MDRRRSLALALAAAILAVGCGAGASPSGATPSAATATGSGSADSAARQYCADKGGQLVDRTAFWNTNADRSAWLQLAGRQTFCEFESGTGDQTTRISVDLTTL